MKKILNKKLPQPCAHYHLINTILSFWTWAPWTETLKSYYSVILRLYAYARLWMMHFNPYYRNIVNAFLYFRGLTTTVAICIKIINQPQTPYSTNLYNDQPIFINYMAVEYRHRYRWFYQRSLVNNYLFLTSTSVL